MASFLKSLFGGKTNTSEEQQKKETKNFEILKFDGLRAQRIGRVDYAVRCFTEALMLQEDFETMNYLSSLYIRLGETRQARDLLTRMITLEPDLPATYLAVSHLCYIEEKYEEMEQHAAQAIRLNADDPVAHYLLGKSRHCQKDPIGAVAHLTQALFLKEDYTDALLARGEILLEMKQLHEAREDIDTILKTDPEHEAAILLRGNWHEAAGAPEAAETDYRQLIALNPFNESAYIILSRMFTEKKEIEKAINILDEAIEFNPGSATLYHRRGALRLLHGDKEGSVEDSKKALELNANALGSISGQFNNQPASSNVLGSLG
ncbi:MAG: tetratricopeptide repeat protein [Bacteroides sp.]|nr:tetratricopeptide repeat protein [Bacteroides sp.]